MQISHSNVENVNCRKSVSSFTLCGPIEIFTRKKSLSFVMLLLRKAVVGESICIIRLCNINCNRILNCHGKLFDQKAPTMQIQYKLVYSMYQYIC